MRPRLGSAALALTLGAACSAPSPLPVSPVTSATVLTASAPPPAPPTLRLPKVAAPLHYKVELTLAPDKPAFDGDVTIDLDVAEAAPVLWLNGSALTITTAVFEGSGKRLVARAIDGGEEYVGFAFDEPLPLGKGTLRVVYRGTVSEKDDHGIFVEEEEGKRYLFTQFESTRARRAFPCFDEPSYKVPWQVVLHVPNGDTALSNTPVTSELVSQAGRTFTFAETKPLPSYLVAFAVGPFDLVDAGRAGKKGTAVRIAVPKGQGSQAALAAKTTPEVLARIEDLLGVPYPYEKLDVVSVPRLVTFGAMENAGLITFTRFGLLAKPEEQTHAFEMRMTATLVHELGHHWFGDLVTTAWWDDIWLNEAFASWIEAKIIVPWKPAWHYDAGRLRSTGRAMQSDGLASVRRIRQPIASNDDILNAFDDITYSKGSAVIGMFEAYLGKETFAKGLRRYLTDRAHGVATAADLMAALSAEAGKDIGPAFSSFLDQPGVPLVRTELRCGRGAPALAAETLRYHPLGAAQPDRTSWSIPFCYRYGAGAVAARACTLLDGKRDDLPLADANGAKDGAKGCPAWLVPNADATGYYYATYTLKDVDALLQGKGEVSLLERIALARDLGALVATEHGGGISIADALARVPALLRDPSPQVLSAAVSLVSGVRDVSLPPEDRAGYAKLVTKLFGARAHALGWRPKPNEDEELRLMRPSLLVLVADRGGDAALGAEAEVLAARWLDDPKAIEEDVVDAVLQVAIQRAPRPVFKRLREVAKAATDDVRRRHALAAMARSRDPEVVKESLGILLGKEHDIRDAMGLLWQDARMADVTFAFVKEHFDALVERLPHETHGQLPGLGDAFCDDAHRAEVEAYFSERVARLPGGPRNLARTLDRIRACSALRKAQAASLHGFLEKL